MYIWLFRCALDAYMYTSFHTINRLHSINVFQHTYIAHTLMCIFIMFMLVFIINRCDELYWNIQNDNKKDAKRKQIKKEFLVVLCVATANTFKFIWTLMQEFIALYTNYNMHFVVFVFVFVLFPSHFFQLFLFDFVVFFSFNIDNFSLSYFFHMVQNKWYSSLCFSSFVEHSTLNCTVIV